jgi:tRNA (mo5U34)-methyltransferase
MEGHRFQQPLVDRVAAASWYHTLELPGGITTPGDFDTLDELARVPFPDSLEGRRCLDVGTADGFWAYEMERRGASEVLAIDLRRFNWPGAANSKTEEVNAHKFDGFDIAHDALESKVHWRELSVYDLAPDIVGTFDFVFMGSLLLHLRDPIAALAAISGVLQGELLSVDAISPPLTALHPRQPIARLEAPGWALWWSLNLQAYRKLFEAANLEILRNGRPFFVKPRSTYRYTKKDGTPLYQRLSRIAATKLGILHSWVRATTLHA